MYQSKTKKKQVYFEKVNLYSSRNYFKNCSMVSSNIADLLHSSLICAFKKYEVRGLCLMKWPTTSKLPWGIEIVTIPISPKIWDLRSDPVPHLNLGSKIPNLGSEVIEIDRDRKKIANRQCTVTFLDPVIYFPFLFQKTLKQSMEHVPSSVKKD